ncbi:protein kinase [Actinoplanes sp. NPDC000266]
MTDDGHSYPGAVRGVAGVPGTVRDHAAVPSAPGTTRDAAGAPGTTRDAAGAPGTTRDAAGAPGTTRDAAGAPGTTRDGGVASEPFARVNLPPTLRRDYDYVRELGAGGEADLLLVRDRATGAECVVRLYRRQDLPLDEEKLNRLRTADPRHLIGLLGYGRGDGYVWEILEYAPYGSLEQLMSRYPAPWPADKILDVFDQLAPAITYANSLGMVHRDIKPGNVLIRSMNPADLVLADFGLTKFIEATHAHGTNSRTSAYAPPEAIAGHTSKWSDWWSLGIIMFELLTGRNPFQNPDGTWFNEQVITSILISREISVSDIADDHWRLLVRGLLTRVPEKRWGPGQTAAWRAGGKPPVADPEPARDPGRPVTKSSATFVFEGVGYNDPVALAAALRRDWGGGRRLLAGRAVKAPTYLALKDWMTKHERNEAVQALNDGVDERPERGLMQVIMALDPDSPPEFNGRRLDDASLRALTRDAIANEPAARQILGQIYEDGILTICDDTPGCAGYALLDDRWHRNVEAAQARLRQTGVTISQGDLQTLRMQLLVASYAGQESLFAEPAAGASSNAEALRQPWFRALVADRPDPRQEAPWHAALMLTAPVATQQTRDQHVEAERARLAEEQRRIAESRANMDRVSVPIGVVCGVIAFCAPPAGALAGPAAVYFGVRARRTRHRAASTWAIGLGAVGFVFAAITIIMYLASLASGAAA